MKYLACIFALLIPSFAQAGRLPEPAKKTNSLDSKENITYSITFEGDVFAQVSVEASGEIDCALIDSTGAIVAVDMLAGNSCSFLWIPKKDETFAVKLMNTGKKSVTYSLETN